MSSDSPTTTTSLNERTAAVVSSSTAAAATSTTNTTTMKAPTTLSTSTPPRMTTVRLTNTNTDNLCCDKDDNIFKKYLYRFNLWTGLYMLNPYEQMVFHLVCWFSVGVSLAYFAVFASGFFEGLRRAAAAATAATTEQEE